jgi:hypothetical protein
MRCARTTAQPDNIAMIMYTLFAIAVAIPSVWKRWSFPVSSYRVDTSCSR